MMKFQELKSQDKVIDEAVNNRTDINKIKGVGIQKQIKKILIIIKKKQKINAKY